MFSNRDDLTLVYLYLNPYIFLLTFDEFEDDFEPGINEKDLIGILENGVISLDEKGRLITAIKNGQIFDIEKRFFQRLASRDNINMLPPRYLSENFRHLQKATNLVAF